MLALVSVDDYNLVTAHRLGDSEAFDLIVRRYHAELTAHARRNLNDAHAAEDIVQEAFLRAYRALPSFEGEYRLGAWLHRIVENLCIDQSVRRRRDMAVNTRLQARADEFEMIDVDSLLAKETCEQALSRLSDEHRDTLVQRFVEDKSYEDIATGSGISQDVARARVSHAAGALRRLFDLPAASVIVIGGFARRIAHASARGSGVAVTPAEPRHATRTVHVRDHAHGHDDRHEGRDGGDRLDRRGRARHAGLHPLNPSPAVVIEQPSGHADEADVVMPAARRNTDPVDASEGRRRRP